MQFKSLFECNIFLPEPFVIILMSQRGPQGVALTRRTKHVGPPGQFWVHGGSPALPEHIGVSVKGVGARATTV